MRSSMWFDDSKKFVSAATEYLFEHMYYHNIDVFDRLLYVNDKYLCMYNRRVNILIVNECRIENYDMNKYRIEKEYIYGETPEGYEFIKTVINNFGVNEEGLRYAYDNMSITKMLKTFTRYEQKNEFAYCIKRGIEKYISIGKTLKDEFYDLINEAESQSDTLFDSIYRYNKERYFRNQQTNITGKIRNNDKMKDYQNSDMSEEEIITEMINKNNKGENKMNNNDVKVIEEVETNIEVVEEISETKNVLFDKMMERVNRIGRAYIIKGKNYALTPSGLSINGIKLSDKDNAALETDGSQIISDIPVGIKLPTALNKLIPGDIVFTKENEPVRIDNIYKQTNNGEYCTVYSYKDKTMKTLYPSVSMLTNDKTYDKLITPFNYDFGNNPIFNMSVLLTKAYFSGGVDRMVDDTLPKLMPLIGRYDLIQELFKSKLAVYILAAGGIGLELNKNGMFENFGDKLSGFKFSKSDSSWLKEKLSDKKILFTLITGVGLLIYFNREAISKKIKKEKLKYAIKNPGKVTKNFINDLKEKGITKFNELKNKFSKKEIIDAVDYSIEDSTINVESDDK